MHKNDVGEDRAATRATSLNRGKAGRLLGTGGHFRSRRYIALLTVAVVGAIGLTAGSIAWHSRVSALKERQHSMNSMGIVLIEQTSLYVQMLDLILSEVQANITNSKLTSLSDFRDRYKGNDAQTYLAERIKNIPQVDAIVLIDADGHALNSSRLGSALPSAADRDYYTYFKQHADPGLFIGSLLTSRVTGKLSLFFARRVSGADDTFLGLVLAIVQIRNLSDFYQAAGEHLGQTIALLRRDGTVLLRYPDPERALGLKLQEGSPWYKSVSDGGGSYTNTPVLTGVRSLLSTHLLHDYPLVVTIAMDEADVFVQWHKEIVYIATFAVVAALSFTILFWTLWRQFHLQVEQNTKLEEAAIALRESKQILSSYAEMSADWFWEQDTDFRFKFCTDLPFIMAPNDVGKTRRELGDPAMAEERWIAHEADLAARRPFRNFCWERIGSDGEPHFLSTSGDPFTDRDGRFAGYRGTGQDITAKIEAAARLMQANRQLQMGHQKFEAVLSNIKQGVCFFDHDKRLQVWNQRFAEIYDLKSNAFSVGCTLKEIVDLRHAAGSTPDITPADYLARQELLIDARLPASFVVPLRNGRFIDIYHHPLPEGGWVSTHEDITDRHQFEASVLFMARHDALTKLPNRLLFRERMEQAISMVERGSQFSVFCLDLDKFKQVNDTFGHPMGDALLAAVADRLRACIRETDTIARLGGDEFAIIQTGLRQPDEAEALASRIAAAFLEPFDLEGHQITSGVSVGVAVAPGDGASYEALMRDADIALYLAKTEHRGAARFFEPEMDARIHLRRSLEQDLKDALARNEFELYYQPQVSLISNEVSGFEALLRWNHPVRGFVSPLEFIQVAEETGLIVAIGQWVLRVACCEAQNWPPDISVAVNLSPIQFKGDLVATVREALDASGLLSKRLQLEITESVFLGATTATISKLLDFRDMGVAIALDDFGTGYSSLSYLRSFAVNKIKIDQSFIRDLLTSRESMSIVRAVTGLGQSLGMMTIAEGVETQDQVDELRELGCTEVQGYFFGRPKPASEVFAVLDALRGQV